MRWIERTLAVVAVVLGLWTVPVAAQDAAPAGAPTGAMETPDDRATSFRAVSGAEAEQVPGGTLMVASYALIWLFLMLYLHRIGRLSAAVRADVERLSAAVEGRGGPGSPR